MKTSKKMLSLLLIAAMLVSVLCVGVSATEDYDPVSISEGEPVTISWNGTTGTVVSVDGSSYIPKVTVTSAAENIYVNGTKVTSGSEITFSTPSGSTNYVQIITQSGTEAPYITMVKITR